MGQRYNIYFKIKTVFPRFKNVVSSPPKSSGVKQLITILLITLSCTTAFAQDKDEEKRVDFYGYVVTADSLYPIRNTHVISKMAHCGTITDLQGWFHILAYPTDTLWVSCVGYSRRLVAIDTTITSSDTLVIRLRPETITLREVTVLPFSNYEGFKEMLINMPSIKTPDELKRLDEDLKDLWLSHKPIGNGKPTITANPIQYLYDKYNRTARFQATLKRNRKMYNEVLREQGRTDELLPDSLDYAIEYHLYDFEGSQENKPKVPRKKYIKIGQ